MSRVVICWFASTKAFITFLSAPAFPERVTFSELKFAEECPGNLVGCVLDY